MRSSFEAINFQCLLEKEQARVKSEADFIAKSGVGLKIKDTILVKYVRGHVKKTLMSCRNAVVQPQSKYEDFLNN